MQSIEPASQRLCRVVSVLDFTAGSFTTGVACAKLGLNFIGIEKDKTYYEIGKMRIDNELKEQ